MTSFYSKRDRQVDDARRVVVIGKRFGLAGGDLGELGRERCGDGKVELLSPILKQTLVGGVLNQRMLEG